jgi:AraC-like DNA-binding protein
VHALREDMWGPRPQNGLCRKEVRHMEWVDDLNRAMGYIEENLAGRIDLTEIARLAACSQFHLQRMFPYLCGMTLSDYIRRRRMSCAALNPDSHRGAFFVGKDVEFWE